jgi:hypothetical protein
VPITIDFNTYFDRYFRKPKTLQQVLMVFSSTPD